MKVPFPAHPTPKLVSLEVLDSSIIIIKSDESTSDESFTSDENTSQKKLRNRARW